MNKSHTVSASSSSTNLIDAKLEEHQIICGSKQCPSCGHKLDMKPDWLGLPAGVKFDPTDQELMEHLEAKVSAQCLRSHPLIDEFIPTIDGEDGICYTHPEKLPGVTRDGLSKHFFHRPSKAYTTGTRKRRKIHLAECDVQRGETRWHKTGKTRPVMVNGRQKGCKKILVLYTNFGKHRKPEKTNWVMHQYHLGEMEEEKDGELVVSKIFYQTQPRQCGWTERSGAGGGADAGSGSCSSSSKQRDDLSSAAATAAAAGMAVYSGMDQLQKQQQQQHMNQPDNFSFAPFRESFDEVGIGVTSATRSNEASIGHEEQEEQDHHHHHHQQQQHQHAAVAATAAFHISRPTNPISAIISPSAIHQTSMVLDDPFHVSRIFLQADKFHEQQQQQQKLVGRSAGAGLEELIMGCTSNSEIKAQETSIPHPQETEWLKYTYWSPDSHDHHE